MTKPARPIRALIADDEPLLRELLRFRLKQVWPDLEIVAEAENGAEALTLFEEYEPDLVFLDIQMPVLTGLDAARALCGRCHVVFVTAYDQYAVEAFNQRAIDYILKPVNAERLTDTVERIQERMGDPHLENSESLQDALNALGVQAGAAGGHLKWIKALLGQNLRLISVADVIYFQAEDKYTKVVVADAEALIKKPIKELSEELDPDMFWQIHRATIVNVNHVASVGRDDRDHAIVRLKDREEILPVSRAHAHLFKQM
jgi:DNA-binding LytR/AlgR family response regulator